MSNKPASSSFSVTVRPTPGSCVVGRPELWQPLEFVFLVVLLYRGVQWNLPLVSHTSKEVELLGKSPLVCWWHAKKQCGSPSCGLVAPVPICVFRLLAWAPDSFGPCQRKAGISAHLLSREGRLEGQLVPGLTQIGCQGSHDILIRAYLLPMTKFTSNGLKSQLCNLLAV